MTKYEFLGDLSRLLSDLPEEERRQAMKYYEDYFADAGESREQDVLLELGSPEEIAKQIKSDMSENIEYGEGSSSKIRDFAPPYRSSSQNTRKNEDTAVPNNAQADDQSWQTQTGSQDRQGQTDNQSWQTQADSQGRQGQTDNQSWQTQADSQGQTNNQNWQTQNKSSADSSRTILFIIIAVATSPIWGSILVGIFSLLIGIVSAIIGLFSALILGGGGVAIGGIACVFGGIVACVTGEIASGMLTTGIGCVMFSVGSVCCYLGIMLCVKLLPALWHECVKGFHWGKNKFCQTFHA